MTTFILVLLFHYDSNAAALTSIPGFKNLEDCEMAGRRSVERSIADRFVCLTSNPPKYAGNPSCELKKKGDVK